MSSLRTFLHACALAALACVVAPLAGQSVELSGRVLAPDSTSIRAAAVRVTAPDGVERVTATDSSGRYRFLVSGPGEYAVEASAFGYVTFTTAVRAEPGEARVRRDVRLSARPVALSPLTVVAAAATDPEDGTPAEQAARWDAFLSHVYPLDPGDFADVGSIAPGAVRAEGGLSLAGQAPSQNGTTVDGAIYGGGSLPSEGVRSVAVLGTVYDVSRGQFSGGQVAATTISGTNLWGGAFTARLDEPSLRRGGPSSGLAGEAGRLLRLSGGGGGALIRDRLFVYGALDASRADATLPALDRLEADALRRLPLEPDSALRFAGIARRLGAAPAEPWAAANRSSRAMSALARVDWALPHGALTARVDARGFELGGLGASPYRLAGGTENAGSRDAGVLLQHAGSWGGVANTLRAYRSAGRTRTGEAAGLPAGIVRVSSVLEDGTRGTSFLSLGGVDALPGDEREVLELSDDLRLVRGGGHEVRAGFVVQRERAARDAFVSAGTFTFNSLAELDQGRAASFTRALGGAGGEAERTYAALYLGDSWAVEGGPWLAYGVRVEGSRYAPRPALDPRLTVLAGEDGERVPADLAVTPRFGFSYGPGRWILEGGFGGFAGVPALGPLAARWGQTGAEGRVLSCVGDAAPAAEWTRYAADPSTLPTACADGSPAFASAAPAATVWDRGFRGARSWRASLAARRALTPRSGVRLDALVARGTGLPSAKDRNLHAEPAFRLAGEDGRPVFAPASRIDPASGAMAAGAARPLADFGAVEALGSRGESWTTQLSADYAGIVGRATQVGLRYTFTRSRILAGGIAAPGAAPATTAGDPARLEWAEAPFTPRHHLSLVVTGHLHRRLRWSAIGMLQSGRPFTPLVGADVNGDGRANDRAYLFDPDQVDDPAVAEGLRRLWTTAPAGARRCLRAGVGRIAAPGACRTAWTPSLDLRVELTPLGALNARRFVVGIDARNVHQLVPALRGWSGSLAPDATLLHVRGFDPARGAFLYDVNPRFGRALEASAGRAAPFQLVVEGRITVGADPRYQPLMRAIDLGMGNSRATVRAQLAERVRNAPWVVLQLHGADTTALALSNAQRAYLRAAADALAPRLGAEVDSLAAAFTAPGAAEAVRAARVQEAGVRILRLQEAAFSRMREILTPVQWTRLPAWITRPVDPAALQQSPRFEMTAN